MNVRIKQNTWQARIAARVLKANRVAIVLGNTIYLWGVTEADFMRDKKWLAHELTHVQQFTQYGKLRFIVMYLWESLQHGYHNNKFEKEARDSESSLHHPI